MRKKRELESSRFLLSTAASPKVRRPGLAKKLKQKIRTEWANGLEQVARESGKYFFALFFCIYRLWCA